MINARDFLSSVSFPDITLNFRRNGFAAGITIQVFATLLLSLFAFEKGVTNSYFYKH